MLLLIWRFITFLLAALTLGMAFCHLLEMSPKMKYDVALYTTLQQTLYRNFGVPLGAAIETSRALAPAGISGQRLNGLLKNSSITRQVSGHDL